MTPHPITRITADLQGARLRLRYLEREVSRDADTRDPETEHALTCAIQGAREAVSDLERTLEAARIELLQEGPGSYQMRAVYQINDFPYLIVGGDIVSDSSRVFELMSARISDDTLVRMAQMVNAAGCEVPLSREILDNEDLAQAFLAELPGAITTIKAHQVQKTQSGQMFLIEITGKDGEPLVLEDAVSQSPDAAADSARGFLQGGLLDFFQPGDRVKAQVLAVDREGRRNHVCWIETVVDADSMRAPGRMVMLGRS